MSKSIYEEAIELMKLNILPRETSKTAKLKVIHALQQALTKEKLLELYKKLAEHRSIVINRLLDEIMENTFNTTEQFINYIIYEIKPYVEIDFNILNEIKKIKEK